MGRVPRQYRDTRNARGQVRQYRGWRDSPQERPVRLSRPVGETAGLDADIRQVPGRLMEKRRLFSGRFKQRHARFRPQHCHRNPGKPGPRPDIDEGLRRWQFPVHERGLAEVSPGRPERVAHRCEVDAAIPMLQEPEVPAKQGELGGGHHDAEFV